MLKVRFSFTEEHADMAHRLAAKIYAMFPTYFEMKTPEPDGDVSHIFLNPRKKRKCN